MRSLRLLAAALLGAFTACGAPAGSPPPGVCRGASQSCTETTDCCSGFLCETGVCIFVGGAGNASGGGNSTGAGSGPTGTAAGSTGGNGLIGGSSSAGSTGNAVAGSNSGGETSGGHSTTGGIFGSGPSSASGSSTGQNFGASSSSSSGGGNGSTTGGQGSSTGAGNGSTSGGNAGSCLTLPVTGYPSTCLADGGSGQCPTGLVCAYDPTQSAYECTYTCAVSADCPDIATVCMDGACVDNPCGQTTGAANGTINGACDADGHDDGTCVPTTGLTSPGVCLQTGGTTTTTCNPFTRCGDRSQLCETGWACDGTFGTPGPGTCVQVCNPGGPAVCPAGDVCATGSDGDTECQLDGGSGSVGDAGFPFPDSGLGTECGSGTGCSGCAAGQTCFCLETELACVPGTGCLLGFCL
ncbi:MAG TPA: hypothetical protein VMB50_10870 [Myxococcales bacterium]|nr:hypothetical protein [Myxococcales bacterium]